MHCRIPIHSPHSPPNPLLVRRISTIPSHSSQIAPENRPGIPRIHELNRPLQNRHARQRTTRRREVQRLLAARKKTLHALLPHQHVGARAGLPQVPADMVRRVVRQHFVVRRDPAGYARGTQPGETTSMRTSSFYAGA